MQRTSQLTLDLVQGESRCLVTGRSDPSKCYISSDEMLVILILVEPDADIPSDLGLQVLDNVIMTRWKVLPREQCQGSLKCHAWMDL